MYLLLRWFINAVALLVAAALVPGIRLGRPGEPEWATLAVVALIFGIVNVIIRPIVLFFTLPLTLITLGLFIFVVNAVMLLITGAIASGLHLGFRVETFGAALLGALVISAVSFVLHRLLPA